MFVNITLPWQYKCGILLYDAFLSFLSVDTLGQQMYVTTYCMAVDSLEQHVCCERSA